MEEFLFFMVLTALLLMLSMISLIFTGIIVTGGIVGYLLTNNQ